MGSSYKFWNFFCCYRILSRRKVILSTWRIFMWNPNWMKRKFIVIYAQFCNNLILSNLSELKVKKKWNFCGLRMTVDNKKQRARWRNSKFKQETRDSLGIINGYVKFHQLSRAKIPQWLRKVPSTGFFSYAKYHQRFKYHAKYLQWPC